MAVETRTFAELVRAQVAAIQYRLKSIADPNAVVDMSVGSVFRALVESNATVGLWLQALALEILRRARAATSDGPHLDSWMADFRQTRLAGTKARGNAAFYRNTATSSAAYIPVGSQIATADGRMIYSVLAAPSGTSSAVYDTNNSRWIIAPNATAASVLCEALSTGTAGNAAVLTVTSMLTPIVGVDSVLNLYAFTGGSDTETDAQFRERFHLWVASRGRCTRDAISYAIRLVSPNIRYQIIEGQTFEGAPAPGTFVVVVDDGTAATTTATLSAIAASIESYRPVGTIYSVRAPLIVYGSIHVTVTVDSPSYPLAATGQLVDDITTEWAQSRRVGQDLDPTDLFRTILAGAPGVVSVTGIYSTLGSGLPSGSFTRRTIRAHEMFRLAVTDGSTTGAVTVTATPGVREG